MSAAIKNNPLMSSILLNKNNIQEVFLISYCFVWGLALLDNRLAFLLNFSLVMVLSFVLALFLEKLQTYAYGKILFQNLLFNSFLLYVIFLIVEGRYFTAFFYTLFFTLGSYRWLYPNKEADFLCDFFVNRAMIESHLSNGFPSFYKFRKYSFWVYVLASFLIVPIAKAVSPEYSGQ